MIDFLDGQPKAIDIFDQFETDRAVSVVTWIEVLAGPPAGEEQGRLLLSRFQLLQITSEVAEATILIRRERKKLKLPDALILATARVSGRMLVTRNTKDFSPEDAGVVIPYQL